ncbi:XdhC family protein [Gellertiella hungarica]|uniref:Xanthine dehydrogenase accessory factor n=1 Tax=Gellertiella hungarica TaxID=1572859 RepID=A0A7W6NKL3_9HYPH|nr:XdhC family protein [Gellertiella hungarica]MBB4064659.1 xanthine dehydrogenase accessory factor [Gellertiella hungarica]
MKREVLHAINRARVNRKAVATLTGPAGETDRVFHENDLPDGPLGEALARAFRTGKPGPVELESGNAFVNVYLPPVRIVVIGAVHISQALAPMARIAGYDLSVIDPRTAFATPERFDGVDLRADWPEDVLAERPLDAHTALAALTHDPKIDDFPLSAALSAGCFYVGALGSRKTHVKRVERLLALGHTESEIARISAPIGLDIGAATPAEIAVAVLGDIIAAYRRRGLASPAGDGA